MDLSAEMIINFSVRQRSHLLDKFEYEGAFLNTSQFTRKILPSRLRLQMYLDSSVRELSTDRTELSKYIWSLKREGKIFRVNWDVLRKAPSYSNLSKRCDLCLTEKLMIISADKSTLLNKRSELISKCRHQNKFYLSNFVGGVT